LFPHSPSDTIDDEQDGPQGSAEERRRVPNERVTADHNGATDHLEGGERLAPGFGPIWVEVIPESISAWGIDTSAYEPPNSRKVVTP